MNRNIQNTIYPSPRDLETTFENVVVLEDAKYSPQASFLEMRKRFQDDPCTRDAPIAPLARKEVQLDDVVQGGERDEGDNEGAHGFEA